MADIENTPHAASHSVQFAIACQMAEPASEERGGRAQLDSFFAMAPIVDAIEAEVVTLAQAYHSHNPAFISVWRTTQVTLQIELSPFFIGQV